MAVAGWFLFVVAAADWLLFVVVVAAATAVHCLIVGDKK